MEHKITKYFIAKHIADRLIQGETIHPIEIELYSEVHLRSDNEDRIAANHPWSLVPCGLILGST